MPRAQPRSYLPTNFQEKPKIEPPRRYREQTDPTKRAIVFFEEGNPRSVVNLMTDKMRAYAIKLPAEYLSMPSSSFEKETKFANHLSDIDRHLRIAFWDEYFLTVDNGEKKMRPEAIYAKVCSKEFFNQIVENPIRFAYMLKPPEDYILQMRSLLDIGLKRFSEVLQLPIVNKEGVPQTKLIAEIVKIVTIIDNRVKGAVTQKIQLEGDFTSKNLNVNVSPNENYEAPKSYKEITQELKDIESEIKKLSGGGAAVPSLFGDTDENTIDIIPRTTSESEEERVGAFEAETEVRRSAPASVSPEVLVAREVHQFDEQDESADSGESDREEFSTHHSGDQ